MRAVTYTALETQILLTALEMLAADQPAFHGYLIAAKIQERGYRASLAAYGSIYRALRRLETARILHSWWADPVGDRSDAEARDDFRPRRRMYQLTAAGQTEARRMLAEAPQAAQLRLHPA